jgi:hypothetical protein
VLEERPVQERRAVLDREAHRVEVVLVQDHRDRLVEELVEHPVAKQVAGEGGLVEALVERRRQVAAELVRAQVDVVAEARIAHEALGVGEVRIAHQRRDVRAPRGERDRVERDLAQVEEVVVVIAAEELVRGRTADRHLVARPVNRLHQEPVDVVGDRRDRRVVVADERS